MFFPSKVLLLNQTYPIESFFTLPAIDIQPPFFRRLVFIGFWAQFGLLPSELDASVSHQIIPTLEVALTLPNDFHDPESVNFSTGSLTINVIDKDLFLQSLTTSHPALSNPLGSNLSIDPSSLANPIALANNNLPQPGASGSIGPTASEDVHIFLRFDGYIFQILSYHDYRCKTIKLYNRQAEVIETYQLDIKPTFEINRKDYYQTAIGINNSLINWDPVDISQGSPPVSSTLDTTIAILSNEELILTKPHIVPGHLPSRLSQFPGSTQWVRDSGLSRQCLPWYGGCVHLFPVELLGQLIVNRKSRTFRLRTPDDAKLDTNTAVPDYFAYDGDGQLLNPGNNNHSNEGNDSGEDHSVVSGRRGRSTRISNAQLAASSTANNTLIISKEAVPPTPQKQRRGRNAADGGANTNGNGRGVGKRGKETKGDRNTIQNGSEHHDKNQYNDDYYGRGAAGNGGVNGGGGNTAWLPGSGSSRSASHGNTTSQFTNALGNDNDNQSDSDNELFNRKAIKRPQHVSSLTEFEQNDFLLREKRVEAVQAIKIPPAARPYVEAMDVTLTNHLNTQTATIRQLVQQNQVMLESVNEMVQFSGVMQIQLRQMMGMMMNQQSEYLTSVGKFESLVDGLLEHVTLITTNPIDGNQSGGDDNENRIIELGSNFVKKSSVPHSVSHPTTLSPLQAFFNMSRAAAGHPNTNTNLQNNNLHNNNTNPHNNNNIMNPVHNELSPFSIHQFTQLPPLSDLQVPMLSQPGQSRQLQKPFEPSQQTKQLQLLQSQQQQLLPQKSQILHQHNNHLTPLSQLPQPQSSPAPFPQQQLHQLHQLQPDQQEPQPALQPQSSPQSLQHDHHQSRTTKITSPNPPQSQPIIPGSIYVDTDEL